MGNKVVTIVATDDVKHDKNDQVYLLFLALHYYVLKEQFNRLTT